MSEVWLPLAKYASLTRGVALYVIRNKLSGLEYVGISLEVRERLRRHHIASTSQRLHRAIRKHGAENFEVTISYQPLDREALTNLEIRTISERGTYASGGYNDTRGGDGGWEGKRHSQASIEKMRARAPSRGMIGRKHSPETLELMAEAKRGTKASDSTKEKLRVLAKKHIASGAIRPGQAQKRAVFCWVPGSFTPIEFDSVITAAKWAGVSKSRLWQLVSRPPAEKQQSRSKNFGAAWAYVDEM